jgi:PII-like signaling protein
MNGYQVTFFTEQNRRHGHQQLSEWLLQLTQSLGLRGATLTAAQEGIGSKHHLHSAHFIELADQPVEVTMVVSEDESKRLFDRLAMEPGLHIFYTKIPAEFGVIETPK